jgi:hypothetical protein
MCFGITADSHADLPKWIVVADGMNDLADEAV